MCLAMTMNETEIRRHQTLSTWWRRRCEKYLPVNVSSSHGSVLKYEPGKEIRIIELFAYNKIVKRTPPNHKRQYGFLGLRGSACLLQKRVYFTNAIFPVKKPQILNEGMLSISSQEHKFQRNYDCLLKSYLKKVSTYHYTIHAMFFHTKVILRKYTKHLNKIACPKNICMLCQQ